ncbi:uncharacterized protein LOC143041690 [Oratosquilla oratoria]|uniref:uncharacterized protein LOC143041690 n=1 Tax=Oratosquilla oratoria TaxID=337810 RepID=UPI003F761C67
MISMAFRTNSSYLSPANEILMKVKESGIFDKWLADELTNTTQCLRPPSSDGTSEGIKPLNIENFLGPILILAAGLGLGLLSLLLEISVGKFGSNKE